MTSEIASRLDKLRAFLKKKGLNGFIIPMADEYQSEYVPVHARRLEFITGFTGSAGLLIVFEDKAAFFTDGRYTLQAEKQLPKDLFEIHDSAIKSPVDWLKENTAEGVLIGFDSKLHTAENVERLQKTGMKFLPVDPNPVDVIWEGRPLPQAASIFAHDVKYAGQSSVEKRKAIAEELKKQGLDAAVITDPASIAWLLNVRGGDVPHAPLPLSFAIIYSNAKVDWFVDRRKITTDLNLGEEVVCFSPDEFSSVLCKLKGKVRLTSYEASFFTMAVLQASGAEIVRGENPCALPKACKNSVELSGMRNAHRRDGAALIKFFAWLEAKGTTTETEAAEKLEEFRAVGELYRGPSFDTIAGSGPNGAIVHYRATPETNRQLDINSLFLLDSGGQYLDGTTDVTRTIALGQPSDEMRDRFTLVLKGHIALASIRFPEGTTGEELDVLARQFLWEFGLDYSHGTGHGVGSYLSVHEGPQSISLRGKAPLKAGMVVSNEPGYYKTDAYGIRIENLQTVVALPDISSPNHQMLGFETLTLAPIDRRAIKLEMLTQKEKDWLNAYHARVYKELSPLLDTCANGWLEKATAKIL